VKRGTHSFVSLKELDNLRAVPKGMTFRTSVCTSADGVNEAALSIKSKRELLQS